jgi:PHD/YefM family antitoxin component YafN of YafNO toxin-antitoxin module
MDLKHQLTGQKNKDYKYLSFRDELRPLISFENTRRRLDNAHDLAFNTEWFEY